MRKTFLCSAIAWALAVAFPAAAQPATPTVAQGADAAQLQRGQRLFIRCAACHETGEPKVVKVGPHLKGIVGRPAGKLAGYAFSKGLAAATFEWDEARLLAWLQRPSDVVADTTMIFDGMPVEADRRAMLAYLRSLK